MLARRVEILFMLGTDQGWEGPARPTLAPQGQSDATSTDTVEHSSNHTR